MQLNRSRLTTRPTNRAARSAVMLGLIVFVAAIAAPGLGARETNAAKRTKSFHDVGVTTKSKPTGDGGTNVKLKFKDDGDGVGNAHFPSCEGGGTFVNCGGTISLDHLGGHLNTLVEWNCPPMPPFTCDPGKGGLDTQGGKEVGTLTLKVQPDKLDKGKRFPVVVKKFSHPHR